MRPALAPAIVALLSPLVRCQTAQPSKEQAEVAAAYASKIVASALFVSGRTLDSVLAEELAPTRPLEALIRPFLKFDVDMENRAVTCTIGGAKATAVATRNLGCSLVHAEVAAIQLRQRGAPGLADLQPDPATVDWPLGDRLPTTEAAGIDSKALAQALEAAFVEKASGPRMNTRAVVVVHKGRLVAERYAAGYHAAMPLPGWSMTKTLVNALVGIRIAAGALDPAAPLAVPEWTANPDDERHRLRLHDLLSMSAGLSWNEDYDDPHSDALRMLFRSSDHGGIYASQPPGKTPGLEFRYSSGCTNLLCRVLRTTFARDLEYWAFPKQSLFTPLGMRTALIETDPSGTFVGSSYGFACARDWARFGMLYAQDGEFAGRRVLPKGWVAATATPQPASNGRFGSHVCSMPTPTATGRANACGATCLATCCTWTATKGSTASCCQPNRS